MKTGQIVMGMLLAGLVGSSTAVLASDDGRRGASASAYEHASDEAIFNRVGDWFATIGKSGLEKDTILIRRRTERVAKRAQGDVEHQAKQAQQNVERQAKRTQQDVEHQAKQTRQALEHEAKQTQQDLERQAKRAK